MSVSCGGLMHINILDSKGNYSGTSNRTKLVHWPLVSGLHLVQRGSGMGGLGPPSPLSLYQM